MKSKIILRLIHISNIIFIWYWCIQNEQKQTKTSNRDTHINAQYRMIKQIWNWKMA